MIAVGATVSFGAIGFADDYLKVARSHNLGLRAPTKFALQVVVALGQIAFEGCLRLLRDQELWARFSRAARARAEQRYSADLVVPMYERVYEEVLAESPP